MYIFPAIDLIDGKVVRLSKGDYDREKRYSVTAQGAAENFIREGASHLHIVDLDGAKSGKAENAPVIAEIVRQFNLFVEVGGGIRTTEQIQEYLDVGVSRVIIGTKAVTDRSFLENAIAKFGKCISVGVDASGGKVAINGWKEITSLDSLQFCRELKDMGVDHIIYTDISRDGMMNGTNLDIYKVLCQTQYPKITASGGITYIEELKKLENFGTYGAILGKALYENKLSLREAVRLCEGK